MEHDAILKVRGLSKHFGGLVALDQADLTLERGEMHAILGENGAGKSTLVKCVIGLYRADGGHVEVNGQECRVDSPKDAHQLGIGMVHQHFSLVPNMTVLENLVLSRREDRGVINWRREAEALKRFVEGMPFAVDLTTPIAALAAGEKQKVEILKQLYLGHRILILDEPTSVLTIAEADELFTMLRERTRLGELSVLLITHRMREVFKFAENVTVLRRGRVVTSGRVDNYDAESLACHMVGEHGVPDVVPRDDNEIGGTSLRIKGLTVRSDKGIEAVRSVDIDVHSGEIVGIAGVSGNGQRELLEALSGQRIAESGEIEIHGDAYYARRSEMQKHKVHFLPEEPIRNACVASMTVAENLAFRNFDQAPLCRGGWILNPAEFDIQAERLVKSYRIRTPGVHAPIRHLSGGNIQRTVLARELSQGVEVLIASNPCFGLDIGAIAEIHSQIMAARNRGAAVLLVSEDLDELFALSDRMVVMFEGRVVYHTATNAADATTVGQYMTGHAAAQ